MTGFLAALAARAVGEPPALRPRAVHLFEPRRAAVGPLPGLVAESTTGVLGAPGAEPGPDREGERSSRPSGRHGEALDRESTSPARESAPPGPSAHDRREQREIRRAAREGTASALARVSDSAPVPRQAERGASAATERTEAGTGERARREGDASVYRRRAGLEAAVPSVEPRLEPSSETTRAEAPVPADLAGERAQPARPASSDEPRRQPRNRRPSPSPAAPTVDVAAILREEVYRALVAQNAVAARERPVVQEPGRKPPSPRRGTAVVRANGVSTTPTRGTSAEAAPGTAAPTVQVHIDRVSVTRAPAPAAPPPAPAAPSRPLVDHAAYLARRRERG